MIEPLEGRPLEAVCSLLPSPEFQTFLKFLKTQAYALSVKSLIQQGAQCQWTQGGAQGFFGLLKDVDMARERFEKIQVRKRLKQQREVKK